MTMNDDGIVSLKLRDGAEINERNYADYAERAIRENRLATGRLTTTALRRVYGYIINVNTQIDCESDFESHCSDVQYLKVRMAYESGRERSMKEFLEKTDLMRAVNAVKDYPQFQLFCRYAESLVAYFKFYGGRD